MARASASVVGSGTVGPDAIADGSSCGTSEIASVTISARWPARASLPPLIRDRCLRTTFISPIGAPERSSARLTCCFCAKLTPSAGAIQFAEPPPEISTSNRSSAVASAASRSVSSAAFSPASSGTGWPASTTLIRRVGTPWPWRVVAMPTSQRRIELERVEIMPLRGRRHRGCALAGGKADHPAFRHRAQMRRQHEFGMGGGDRGVEDRAQERASVGHVVSSRARWATSVASQVVHRNRRIYGKKPAGSPRGCARRPHMGPNQDS